ncbi:MAG: transposase [Gemmatimonadetes bacterium]|nr:transposase [Gemmatimonadota bacterium]
MPFHITARIQCRERLLAGVESNVVAMMLDARERSDAALVAYAVMPNHLHIVLQQGARPLSDYLQPLLRRIALLVRRVHGWEGHVFERRYNESACLTADYLRNAIAYVHLNGMRASLATSVDSYAWCSNRSFCENNSDHTRSRLAMEDALRIFARRSDDSLLQCSDVYRAFIEWRVLMDARASRPDETDDWHAPSPPCVAGGDDHWDRVYAPHARGEVERKLTPVRRMDLRDLAIVIMRETDPGLKLDDVRRGASRRAVLHVRRKIIRRATAAGYTGRAISSFLGVSPSTVSRDRA